ncbi:hypothetical protein [Desulforhopalus singaporensis]|nr:hypothetical protein [Desulforhopalus singaporensis]
MKFDVWHEMCSKIMQEAQGAAWRRARRNEEAIGRLKKHLHLDISYKKT